MITLWAPRPSTALTCLLLLSFQSPVDARFHIKGRWGAAVFAGVGCLYSSISDCNNSEDLYPAIGAGVIYTLKPEAGFVIRAEYAAGEGDNSAFYLRLGHPF